MADNLTTFMCRLSWNLGASASWNPQGLSRPVMGFLYLYLYILILAPPHLGLGLASVLFHWGFFTKTLYAPLLSTIRATSQYHSSLLLFTVYLARFNTQQPFFHIRRNSEYTLYFQKFSVEFINCPAVIFCNVYNPKRVLSHYHRTKRKQYWTPGFPLLASVPIPYATNCNLRLIVRENISQFWF